jgi:hypothetical protein
MNEETKTILAKDLSEIHFLQNGPDHYDSVVNVLTLPSGNIQVHLTRWSMEKEQPKFVFEFSPNQEVRILNKYKSQDFED